jgi:DNA polymerase III psi subunit
LLSNWVQITNFVAALLCIHASKAHRSVTLQGKALSVLQIYGFLIYFTRLYHNKGLFNYISLILKKQTFILNSYFINSEVFIIPEAMHHRLEASDELEVLVLARRKDYDSQNQLLDNILKAVSLIPGENAVLHFLGDHENINIAELCPDTVDKVICFGLKPSEIAMNAGFHANQFYKTESFSILLTHSLNQLDGNTRFKKALWAALQEAFKSQARF